MPLNLGTPLPLYTVTPFALMLLVIAVFPLWLPHWWESNRNKLMVASALAYPSSSSTRSASRERSSGWARNTSPSSSCSAAST